MGKKVGIFKDYKYFFSIGSTTTQAWDREGNVIIPSEEGNLEGLDNQLSKKGLGTKILTDKEADKTKVKQFAIEMAELLTDVNKKDKILLFNSIGYCLGTTADKTRSENVSFEPVCITSDDSEFKGKDTGKIQKKRLLELFQRKKDHVYIWGRDCDIVDNKGIWRKKGSFDPIGGSWAEEIPLKYVADIGSTPYLYIDQKKQPNKDEKEIKKLVTYGEGDITKVEEEKLYELLKTFITTSVVCGCIGDSRLTCLSPVQPQTKCFKHACKIDGCNECKSSSPNITECDKHKCTVEGCINRKSSDASDCGKHTDRPLPAFPASSEYNTVDPKCIYKGPSGIQCVKESQENSEYCANHTCPYPGCTNSKSSEVTNCDYHGAFAVSPSSPPQYAQVKKCAYSSKKCNKKPIAPSSYCEEHTCPDCENSKSSKKDKCEKCSSYDTMSHTVPDHGGSRKRIRNKSKRKNNSRGKNKRSYRKKRTNKRK